MQFDIKRYVSFSYFLILLISKSQIMKKTYIIPVSLTVNLGSCDAILQTVSGASTLSNTRYGGNSAGNVTSADVKGQSDVNVWDSEW